MNGAVVSPRDGGRGRRRMATGPPVEAANKDRPVRLGRRRTAAAALGLVLVAGLALASPALAVLDTYWIPLSGNWSVPGSWTQGEPTASMTGWVNNGGTVTVDQAGEVCKYLYLGTGAGQEARLEVTAGALTVGEGLYVGDAGTGEVEQAGGSVLGKTYAKTVTLGRKAGGEGIYRLSDGRLEGYWNYVGKAGTGLFIQTGGTVTVTRQLQVGRSTASGTYSLTGGTLALGRGSWYYCYINYSPSGGRGVFNLGDADGTGAITETGTGAGVHLVIRRGDGEGTLRGWGTVGLTGSLENNGRVIADGYGTDRTLDLGSFTSVKSGTAMMPAAGWFAVNRGKVVLPPLAGSLFAGTWSGVWGSNRGLVNSLEVLLRGAAGSGAVPIALLAADRADAPPAGAGTVLGLWTLAPPPTLTFSAGDFIARYDDALAASLGLDESAVRAYRWADGRWWDVTFALDTAAKKVTAGAVHAPAALAVGVGLAAPNQWQASGPASWHQAANWTDGLVPNEATVVAHFLARPGGPAVVTLDADATVGALDLADPDGVTVQGAGTLRLDATVGRPRIDVRAGDHVLAGPVAFAARADLNVTGGSLAVRGRMTPAQSLFGTVRGDGRIRFENFQVPAFYSLTLADVSEAVLAGGPGQVLYMSVLDLGESAPGRPTARLDLGEGNLILDYATGTPSPLASVRNWLRPGLSLDAGYWDGPGIASWAAAADAGRLTALGVLDNTDPRVGGKTTFGGWSVDPPASSSSTPGGATRTSTAA